MKIAHFSDLHYSTQNLTEVDHCFGAAVDDALAAGAELAIVSGDATDHRLEMQTPAVAALANRIDALAAHCPVLMLQGTYSHEPPGTLAVFRLIGGQARVFIADRICQVALIAGQWHPSRGPFYTASEIDALAATNIAALVSCLPTVNKAAIAAARGVDEASQGAGSLIADVLAGFAPSNVAATMCGIPTLLVSHGTVSGSINEVGVPMAGLDHEFTTGALFGAGAQAAMLGHIHQYQRWDEGQRVIAYPGSIGRLHFGERGAKGFLLWEVTGEGASAEFRATPARRMLHVEFSGMPNLNALREIAAEVDGAFVRIRYSVDEEHRCAIDRQAIEAVLAQAAQIKIEGRVLPVTRTRAEGINHAPTLADKLARWCTITASESATSALTDKLALIEAQEPEVIARSILAQGESVTPTSLPLAA